MSFVGLWNYEIVKLFNYEEFSASAEIVTKDLIPQNYDNKNVGEEYDRSLNRADNEKVDILNKPEFRYQTETKQHIPVQTFALNGGFQNSSNIPLDSVTRKGRVRTRGGPRSLKGRPSGHINTILPYRRIKSACGHQRSFRCRYLI